MWADTLDLFRALGRPRENRSRWCVARDSRNIHGSWLFSIATRNKGLSLPRRSPRCVSSGSRRAYARPTAPTTFGCALARRQRGRPSAEAARGGSGEAAEAAPEDRRTTLPGVHGTSAPVRTRTGARSRSVWWRAPVGGAVIATALPSGRCTLVPTRTSVTKAGADSARGVKRPARRKSLSTTPVTRYSKRQWDVVGPNWRLSGPAAGSFRIRVSDTRSVAPSSTSPFGLHVTVLLTLRSCPTTALTTWASGIDEAATTLRVPEVVMNRAAREPK